MLVEQGAAKGIRLADGTEISADMVVGCGAAKDFFEKLGFKFKNRIKEKDFVA